MNLLPLQAWLHSIDCLSDFSIVPLAGDASTRRYFRVYAEEQTFIAMDASLEKPSCLPFVAISQSLKALGLSTPVIFAKDFSQGFLLMTDFGDDLYLKTLNKTNADDLYGRALHALSVMQTCQTVADWKLPHFDAEWVMKEFILFKEWYLERYLALTLSNKFDLALQRVFHFLTESIVAQPTLFMHRDFHSANLLVLPNDQVGILDFQDAFIGPITYDLVSLLRDCYISWPEEIVQKWVLQYYAQQKYQRHFSETDFLRWFDLMGIQRHLKALMTFSRKYCRDQNANYLQHMPRTLNYILQASQKYAECLPLCDLIGSISLCVG
ncbi:MAG: phosphotransferase [Gammaproteobacteria bacterium]|nr:phosphotransferase [Gammaproteobacteria bacterium]